MQDNFQEKLFDEDEEPEGARESAFMKSVLVPMPVDKAYDYAVPAEMVPSAR